MRKHNSIFLMAMLFVATLFSCQQGTKEESQNQEEKKEEKKVV